jgi:hypothetical protein
MMRSGSKHRDHKRETEAAATDLGHGFEVCGHGRVFLEDPIKGRVSLEEAIADARAIRRAEVGNQSAEPEVR